MGRGSKLPKDKEKKIRGIRWRRKEKIGTGERKEENGEVEEEGKVCNEKVEGEGK